METNIKNIPILLIRFLEDNENLMGYLMIYPNKSPEKKYEYFRYSG